MTLYPHFPATHLAVIWRLWGQVSAETIARVLGTTAENIFLDADAMGLDTTVKADEALWKKRGYITLIRNTWHLLSFEQICDLLGVSADSLNTTLKEEDFLSHKLGGLNPTEPALWRKLTEQEKNEVSFIRETYKKYATLLDEYPDDAFRFVKEYYAETDGEPKFVADINGDLRLIYSYFALFGDPLLEDDCDPFPDRLLEEYARYGINGIWMQGVLYQLVPYPFCPELSTGWEKRIKNLNKIIAKAKKYGIGIYLYINEPRAMPEKIFANNPDIKGHARGGADGQLFSLCTSTKAVQDYLDEAMYTLFKKADGLAGFFTITASENQTNCYSHSNKDTCTCRRCSKRELWEVFSEINNIMSRGAKRANPNAKAIAWTWAWPRGNDVTDEIIRHLDKDIILQAVSENNKEFVRGGMKNAVDDYSISVVGPSEPTKRVWQTAKDNGLECSAKVQLNCSWEMPGVPYLPVYDLITEHITNLKQEKIKHLMISWTLGGSPSPNVELASRLLEKEALDGNELREFVTELYGEAADAVLKSEGVFSRAFQEYPFDIGVLYTAPQTSGPKSPFFTQKTGLCATMTCYPFDDITSWRCRFPEDALDGQFEKVALGWREAVEILDAYTGEKNEAFCELYDMMLGSFVHYTTNLNASTYDHNGQSCKIRSSQKRLPRKRLYEREYKKAYRDTRQRGKERYRNDKAPIERNETWL